MQIAGFGRTAKESATELYQLWKHLSEDECIEQIEVHMESEGFSEDEIGIELEALGLYAAPFYELRVCGPE